MVGVQRYRCGQCGFTFRHYPAGVGRSRRSRRLAALAVLLRGVGLSCVTTAQVLQSTQAKISSATVWRAMRQAGLQDLGESRRRVSVKVLGSGEPLPDTPVDVAVRFLESANGESTEIHGMEIWRRRNDPLPADLVQVLESWGARVVTEERPAKAGGR